MFLFLVSLSRFRTLKSFREKAKRTSHDNFGLKTIIQF